jgi:hypothetical protein
MSDVSQMFRHRLQQWLLENTESLPFSENGECPECGACGGEETLVSCFGGRANTAASMNSGPWSACDWQELHECLICNTYFTTEESNY